MCSPEYTVEDIVKAFERLVKEEKLPEILKTYLHEAWKEIEGMESCTDYSILTIELPF